MRRDAVHVHDAGNVANSARDNMAKCMTFAHLCASRPEVVRAPYRCQGFEHTGEAVLAEVQPQRAFCNEHSVKNLLPLQRVYHIPCSGFALVSDAHTTLLLDYAHSFLVCVYHVACSLFEPFCYARTACPLT